MAEINQSFFSVRPIKPYFSHRYCVLLRPINWITWSYYRFNPVAQQEHWRRKTHNDHDRCQLLGRYLCMHLIFVLGS